MAKTCQKSSLKFQKHFWTFTYGSANKPLFCANTIDSKLYRGLLKHVRSLSTHSALRKMISCRPTFSSKDCHILYECACVDSENRFLIKCLHKFTSVDSVLGVQQDSLIKWGSWMRGDHPPQLVFFQNSLKFFLGTVIRIIEKFYQNYQI